MRRCIPALLAALAIACSGDPPTAAVAAGEPLADAASAVPAATPNAPAVPPTAAQAPVEALSTIPPAACELDNHVQFVNAFAQFAGQRPRFVTDEGRARLGDFDITLVDYRWQREPDGVALEVDMTRSGATLDVVATPVERDDDDDPVRTLGPARRFAFQHRDGCWRYAGLR